MQGVAPEGPVTGVAAQTELQELSSRSEKARTWCRNRPQGVAPARIKQLKLTARIKQLKLKAGSETAVISRAPAAGRYGRSLLAGPRG